MSRAVQKVKRYKIKFPLQLDNSYECSFCGNNFDSEIIKDVHMSSCMEILQNSSRNNFPSQAFVKESILSAPALPNPNCYAQIIETEQQRQRQKYNPQLVYADLPKPRKVSLTKDSTESLLYSKKDGTFRGYKTELLKEELPSYLRSFVVCNSCEGLLRKACGVGDPQKLVCLVCADKNNSNAFAASDEAVGNLVINCPLKSRACSWEGNISLIETHMDSCDYFNIECELSCGVILQRIDMESHLTKECPDRLVICNYCLENSKFKDTLSHEEVCRHLPLECVNNCGDKLIRMDMQLHTEGQCPNTLVACTYTNYGCNVKLMRKDLGTHNKENRLEHIEMKTDFIEQKMESEIQKLKNDNTYLREELDKLKLK